LETEELHVGQELILPIGRSTSVDRTGSRKGFREHCVLPHETISMIALQYGMKVKRFSITMVKVSVSKTKFPPKVADLKKINNISSYQVEVGTILQVKPQKSRSRSYSAPKSQSVIVDRKIESFAIAIPERVCF
jgi:hypothetical protein